MLEVNRWDDIYEDARTRQYKNLNWVPIPNAFDSERMQDLLELEDGVEIFGTFVLLLEIASKNKKRGIICTANVQAMYMRIDKKIHIGQDKIKRCIEVLVNEPFKWLMYKPCTGDVQNMFPELNRLDLTGIGNTPPPAPEGELVSQDQTPVSDIIDYLNEKAGTAYKATSKKTQNLIKARTNEKATFEDFKTVISHQCSEWLGDAKMQRYIRPETLFGPKFESYLNDAKLAEKKEEEEDDYSL